VCSPAFAQVSIRAELDRQAAAVGEQFYLIVDVEISEGQIRNDPVVPQLDGLVVRTPSRQSSEVTMLGSRVSRKVTIRFTYPVYAMKEGIYRFSDIHLVHDGRRFTASPVEIVVSKASGPAVGMGDGRSLPDITPGQGLQMVAKFEPGEAYQGQQVILTLTLISPTALELRPQLENVDVNSFRGFFMYDVTPERILQTPIQSQGKTYYVLEVARFALFPLTSGDLTVPPINGIVFLPDTRRRGFGFFDDFFREPQRVRVASTASVLNVKPLPADGRPPGFQTAVGHLSLTAKATRQELDAGDALSLVVEARGEANFRALGSPMLPAMQDITVYDSKQEEKISTAGGRISGLKTWEYVLVPEKAGQYDIGSVKLPVFNPGKEAYEILAADPVRIVVRESARPAEDRIVIRGAGGRQREVVLEGEDFRYIMTDADGIGGDGGLLVAHPAFLALNAVPIFAVGVAWWSERRRMRLAQDPAYARRLRAPGRAREILSAAGKLKHDSNGEFAGLLSKAVVEFLDLRFGIPARGMLSEELERELVANGVDEEMGREVTRFLAELDASRFSHLQQTAVDLDGKLERARRLIQSLIDAS